MKHTLLRLSSLFEDEGWSDGEEIDLRNVEGTNSYCSDEAAEAISRALEEYPLEGLHWIDTGDYHYLSSLWLRKASAPFSLALFDNHTDEQETAFGDILSCGSWVTYVKNNNKWLRAAAPGVPTYISIDIDVLGTEWARTNWDQGEMSLEELCGKVREIAAAGPILGVDICGGITESKGGSAEDFAVNLKTRRVLLELFAELGF